MAWPMAASVRWSHALRDFGRAKPLGAFGALLLLAIIVLAIFAPMIAPHDPLEFFYAEGRLADSSSEHLLGTDHLSRDLFSRLIYGARPAVQLGFLSVLFGTVVGAAIGLVSGYYGGKVDLVLQRFVDAWMAIPGLVIALAIVGSIGASTFNIILGISAFIWPATSRVIRSVALSVKEQPYVEAARALGATDARLITRHVLPQVGAPFIIMASSVLGTAIVIEAALSFLGLGTPAPNPSWGSMLSNQVVRHVREQPMVVVWPGVFISAAVFGANLLGDAMRDVLDPRLRGT